MEFLSGIRDLLTESCTSTISWAENFLEDGDSSGWFGSLIFWLIAALVLYALYHFAKLLMVKMKTARSIADGLEEEHLSLNDDTLIGRRYRGYKGINPIRQIYRKMMLRLSKHGVEIPRDFMTSDIEQMLISNSDSIAAKQLRNFYIKARYSNYNYKKEEIKKQLYKIIIAGFERK